MAETSCCQLLLIEFAHQDLFAPILSITWGLSDFGGPEIIGLTSTILPDPLLCLYMGTCWLAFMKLCHFENT